MATLANALYGNLSGALHCLLYSINCLKNHITSSYDGVYVMIESFQDKYNTLGKIKFCIYLPVFDRTYIYRSTHLTSCVPIIEQGLYRMYCGNTYGTTLIYYSIGEIGYFDILHNLCTSSTMGVVVLNCLCSSYSATLQFNNANKPRRSYKCGRVNSWQPT